MLRRPILALTADRTRRAQFNPRCGDPEEWFDFSTFREHDLYAASFDFFVNWENKSICDEVWIKRISDSTDILEQNEEELLRLISDCDGAEKANRMYLFLKHQRMIQKYMLFRDVPEERWESGEEEIVELDLSRYRGDSVSHFDVEEIQEKIRELRRRPASIGNAGLIYSTSSLEGYLSKKTFFWPGDADTVLFDGDYNVAAVIEFKKHTASSSVTFEDQRIENYVRKDILKYESLIMLRDRFQTDFYVLYYPIPPDINYMIIERIDGSLASLSANPYNFSADERYELPLPARNNERQMRAFAESFIADVLRK